MEGKQRLPGRPGESDDRVSLNSDDSLCAHSHRTSQGSSLEWATLQGHFRFSPPLIDKVGVGHRRQAGGGKWFLSFFP